MLHVTVENLKLFAYHGLYPEEQKLGNWFLLDIDLAYKLGEKQNVEIEETVNYVQVIELTKQRMCSKENLLENVLTNLKTDLLTHFAFLQAIKLKITKYQAPIASFQGQVSVSLNWKK
jgi:7,8-dihydroneopterin aldolase/epimerase/oxygenase